PQEDLGPLHVKAITTDWLPISHYLSELFRQPFDGPFSYSSGAKVTGTPALELALLDLQVPHNVRILVKDAANDPAYKCILAKHQASPCYNATTGVRMPSGLGGGWRAPDVERIRGIATVLVTMSHNHGGFVVR